MARHNPKPAARALAACVVALVTAAAAGCELAIPGDVPSFECSLNDPAACPSGQTCNPATHTCVSGSSSDDGGPMRDVVQLDTPSETTGDDAVTETGDDGHMEAGDDDGIGPCTGTGCACSKASQCASGLCADKQAVSTDIYDKAGMMTFCSKPCCTSNDCDAGMVCFATSSGGNYCVDPTWVGRSPPSASATKGGDPCGKDGDCRSGLCDSGSGACIDTCCSTGSEASQCNAATDCSFAKFPGRGFDVHYTAWCAPPVGTVGNGGSCQINPCRSGLCTCDDMSCNTSHCHDACRNSPDCGSGQACTYIQLTDMQMNVIGVIAACSPSGGNGGKTQGMQCGADTDCTSLFCSPSGVCTDVCFTNADCGGGWRCLPEVVNLKTGGSYEVLDCQP